MAASLVGLLTALHLLGVVFWVGGMLFAHFALRPVAATALEAPMRLTLWKGVFSRFFPWVWAAIIVLLATGLGLIFGFFGGFKTTPLYVHAMFGTGLLMMAIFAYLFFVPFGQLKKAVAAKDWPVGGKSLGQIRILVGINMLIGLLTTVLGSAGRYWVPGG